MSWGVLGSLLFYDGSIYLGCLSDPANALWGVLQIETDPYPIGWAALVFLIGWHLFGRIIDQKPQRGVAGRLVFLGAFWLGRGVMLGACLWAGPWPRDLYLRTNIDGARVLTTGASGARACGSGGQASIVPAMAERLDNGAYRVKAWPRIDFPSRLRCPNWPNGKAACPVRIRECRGVWTGLLWRDQKGVKPGDRLYQGAMRRLLARELISLPRAVLHSLFLARNAGRPACRCSRYPPTQA